MTKIEQLKQAAGLYVDTSGRWANADGVDRLVNLVIRDCAKIAEDTQKFYDEHNDGVVNTEIWTMIKLHFGVEE
jgi:hypothetical protein